MEKSTTDQRLTTIRDLVKSNQPTFTLDAVAFLLGQIDARDTALEYLIDGVLRLKDSNTQLSAVTAAATASIRSLLQEGAARVS